MALFALPRVNERAESIEAEYCTVSSIHGNKGVSSEQNNDEESQSSDVSCEDHSNELDYKQDLNLNQQEDVILAISRDIELIWGETKNANWDEITNKFSDAREGRSEMPPLMPSGKKDGHIGREAGSIEAEHCTVSSIHGDKGVSSEQNNDEESQSRSGKKDGHIGGEAESHLGGPYHIAIDSPLNSLPYAKDAPFNVYQQQHGPTCLPNTRVDLLHDIYRWADGQDERFIFWLSGMAGTGKSTIARTVARRYLDQKRLGASFFFSRGGRDVSHAAKFVTSIALQLASSVTFLDQYICDAIKESRNIASQSLRDQWQQFVLRPLSKLSGSAGQFSYILVIDALDECDNENDIRIIIHLLAEVQLLNKARIRVFLTSRPELSIRIGFTRMPDGAHQDFILHNISSLTVNHDIRLFLERNLELIAQERSLTADWPGEEIISRLVHSANGLFIWAATACRFIREGKLFVKKRLSIILENSSISVNAEEKHLDEIYTTVLRNNISPDYSYEEAEELLSMQKSLLGSIITLFYPLSTQSLSKLLSTAQDDVNQILDNLHAILSVPEDPTLPLRLYHFSVRDFLFDRARCEEFWVDEKEAHRVLANKCVQLMSTSLKQDICGVDAPGMLVTDVEISRVERSLPPETQYACLYWTQHVEKSGTHLQDNGQVHAFLQEHLLHWFEALAWMGKVPEGVYAVGFLESIAVSIR
ncbi:hypothetical protein MMC25_007328 [Agyrium rufum]|nr:hypothetical protein [Agyrium rufum]